MNKTKLRENEVLSKHINQGRTGGISSQTSFQTITELTASNSAITARTAATTNVTLSGLQTIQGVSLGEGESVLLTKQDDLKENWVWFASTGSWKRAAIEPYPGAMAVVVEGALAGALWQVISPAIVVGITDIAVKSYIGNYAALNTTAKTIVPAINEIKATVDAVPIVDFDVNIGGDLYDANTGIKFESGGGLSIVQTGTDGGLRPIIQFTNTTSTPSGTDTQMLYYNGTTLTATSGIRTDGTTVAIGAGLNGNVMLYVEGTDTGIYSEVTDNGGGAIIGYSSNNGIGVFGQGDGANAIGVRGDAADGTAVKGESTNGDGGYFVAPNALAVYGSTTKGVAGLFVQNGSLGANHANNAVSIHRNNTLGAYDTTAAVLRVEDSQAGTGALAEFIKEGVTVLKLSSDKRTHVGRKLQFGVQILTLSGAPYNNDVAITHTLVNVSISSGGIITGLTGGAEGDTVRLVSTTQMTIAHMNTLSAVGNRFDNISGDKNCFAAEFVYLDGYWRMTSYFAG